MITIMKRISTVKDISQHGKYIDLIRFAIET